MLAPQKPSHTGNANTNNNNGNDNDNNFDDYNENSNNGNDLVDGEPIVPTIYVYGDNDKAGPIELSSGQDDTLTSGAAREFNVG